jgi:IstB-like ATP binding protein
MVSRSSASAQTIHSRHTQKHIFHPVSLRSSFLTIRDRGKLIGDVPSATAILDRFLHHAELVQIAGRSYRLRHQGLKAKEGGEESKPANAPTGSERSRPGSKPANAPTGSEEAAAESNPANALLGSAEEKGTSC